MKPHIKKVNGEWVVTNAGFGLLRCVADQPFVDALAWCARMNILSDFVRFSYIDSDGMEVGNLYRINSELIN